MLKISDVAKQLNISASTIRYYDKLGLLTNMKRDENKIRIFNQEDMDRLAIILCLKKTGMSMQDMKEFMKIYSEDCKHIPEKVERIRRQKEILVNKINELEECVEQSDFKLWFYEHIVVDGIEPPYSDESYAGWKRKYQEYLDAQMKDN